MVKAVIALSPNNIRDHQFFSGTLLPFLCFRRYRGGDRLDTGLPTAMSTELSDHESVGALTMPLACCTARRSADHNTGWPGGAWVMGWSLARPVCGVRTAKAAGTDTEYYYLPSG